MSLIKNILKKLTFFISQKQNPLSLNKSTHIDSFERHELLLTELSPFFSDNQSQYDEETIDVLIKLKKKRKRNNLNERTN